MMRFVQIIWLLHLADKAHQQTTTASKRPTTPQQKVNSIPYNTDIIGLEKQGLLLERVGTLVAYPSRNIIS